MGKGYTEAQARATKKYLSSVGEYKLRTDKKDIERYKVAAEQAGMSLNKYIIQTIEEKISHDKGGNRA